MRTVATARVAGIGVTLLAAVLPVQAAQRGGVTTMTFGASHGTQVEYLGAQGRSYLWYPGNRVILDGRWRYTPFRTASAVLPGICFAYGANSYNPVTGARGGWECEPVAVYRAHVVETVAGDIFGLSTRPEPPFDLPADRTTLSALRGRL